MKATAVIRKGTASPSEYTASRPPPSATESCVAASPRIDASAGPTHGVHAIANAAPATSGPPLPARCASASMCHSRFSIGTNSASRNSTPIAMIATPATFSSVWRLSDSALPMPVAVIPSRMKIALNVRMKRPERVNDAAQLLAARRAQLVRA